MRFPKIQHFIQANAVTIDESKRYIGIIFTLFGWFLLGFNSILNYQISKNSPLFVSFFFQFLGAFLFYASLGIIYWIFFGFKSVARYLRTRETLLVLLRGGLGVATFYLFSTSEVWTSIVENSVLFTTEALFVPIILCFFIGNKFRASVWIGISLGFLGVGLTYLSDTEWFNFGGVVGLLGGIGMAVIIILTSYLVKKDSPIKIAFYQILLGLCSSAIIVPFFWETPSVEDMLMMLFSGSIFGIALFLFLDAFYFTESYIIGTLSYSLIFFAEIINWILGLPNKHYLVVPGLTLIVVGGLTVILSSYHFHLNKKKHF